MSEHQHRRQRLDVLELNSIKQKQKNNKDNGTEEEARIADPAGILLSGYSIHNISF